MPTVRSAAGGEFGQSATLSIFIELHSNHERQNKITFPRVTIGALISCLPAGRFGSFASPPERRSRAKRQKNK